MLFFFLILTGLVMIYVKPESASENINTSIIPSSQIQKSEWAHESNSYEIDFSSEIKDLPVYIDNQYLAATGCSEDSTGCFLIYKCNYYEGNWTCGFYQKFGNEIFEYID